MSVYRNKNWVNLPRDFTYIDDIVKGCVGSLDTLGKISGSSGKKRGPVPYWIVNLGNILLMKVPTLLSIL